MSEVKQKTFWQRKEGKTGMLFLGAAAIGFWFALPALLSFVTGLVALVGATIALVIAGVALFILLNIVFSKNVQNTVKYLFQYAMRKITGWIIEMDPINCMEHYVTQFRKQRDEIGSARDALTGQLRLLKKQMDDNDLEIVGASNKMVAAEQAKDQNLFKLNANQKERLKRQNDRFVNHRTLMETMIGAMTKVYDALGFKADDLQNEVDSARVERKMIEKAYPAMKMAKMMLTGDTNKRETYDRAMDFHVEDLFTKVGEIDSFISGSGNIINQLDLESAAAMDPQDLLKIQNWANNIDTLIVTKAPKVDELLQIK